MKLRNSTRRIVTLKTKSHGTMILKPNDCIDASLQLRREVEGFVKQFGLRWELEDADLPPGTDASRYAGTHAYAKNEQQFDARAAQQDDTEEFASVWSEASENRAIEIDEPETEEDEELIFIKETVENKTSSQGSETGEEAEVFGGTGEEAQTSETSQPEISTTETESHEEVFGEEGPDYLRSEPPEGVEGFGDIKQTEYQKIHYEVAPANSPYTKSELMLGVKARLFEICDDLGLNADGTKSELINRIFYYYDQKK